MESPLSRRQVHNLIMHVLGDARRQEGTVPNLAVLLNKMEAEITARHLVRPDKLEEWTRATLMDAKHLRGVVDYNNTPDIFTDIRLVMPR